jgi:uncharacterized protein
MLGSAPQAGGQGIAAIAGSVVEERVIPARGYGAFEVQRGQIVRIVDVEGQQVPDILVYNRHNLKECLSTGYSLSLNKAQNLTTGHTLYSIDCNPLATIVADTVGRHFWGGGFCSEPLNVARFGDPGIGNCRDNLAAALAPYGLAKDDITDGCCLNLFMNLGPRPDGGYGVDLPFSRAGDYLEMRAEMDLLLAISACPQDRNACNAFNPTPIGVVIYTPNER